MKMSSMSITLGAEQCKKPVFTRHQLLKCIRTVSTLCGSDCVGLVNFKDDVLVSLPEVGVVRIADQGHTIINALKLKEPANVTLFMAANNRQVYYLQMRHSMLGIYYFNNKEIRTLLTFDKEHSAYCFTFLDNLLVVPDCSSKKIFVYNVDNGCKLVKEIYIADLDANSICTVPGKNAVIVGCSCEFFMVDINTEHIEWICKDVEVRSVTCDASGHVFVASFERRLKLVLTVLDANTGKNDNKF